MLVDSEQILPITRLQKELTRRVRDLSVSGKPLYILKNNNMEAVVVPFSEYEYLKDLEEMFEYFEINSMLEKRMKEHQSQENITWDNLREG
jgi:PHD/YefM family antitoxin component YafN of YafNO toxin-antitoxin module